MTRNGGNGGAPPHTVSLALPALPTPTLPPPTPPHKLLPLYTHSPPTPPSLLSSRPYEYGRLGGMTGSTPPLPSTQHTHRHKD